MALLKKSFFFTSLTDPTSTAVDQQRRLFPRKRKVWNEFVVSDCRRAGEEVADGAVLAKKNRTL